jgi:hypothetical protein
MVIVNITQSAEEDATDISFVLRGTKANMDFHSEVDGKINLLESGMKIGAPLPVAGPTARQIVLSKGKILMRYDEPQTGVLEIFQFLFAKNNH